MRVLQLIGDLDAGGAENVVVMLANGLARRGVQVTVCTRAGGNLAPRLEAVGLRVLEKRGRLDPGYVWRLCELIRRLQIDVVHAHLFGNNLYGALAGLLTGRRVVLTSHGWDCLRSRKRILAYRALSRLADAVVTVSAQLREDFGRRVGLGEGGVRLVPNGIDVSSLDRGEERPATRARLGVPDDAPLIGAVGNIKPVKGYDVLLRALPRVLESHREARLVIAGGVWGQERYAARLAELAASLGLRERVQFLGLRQDVPDLLRAMDLYVLPSRSEGTSIALLEAMAAGKPIVATRVGGTPRVVEDGVTARLVPPDDPEALASTVSGLLADPEAARRLGSAARRAVESEYTVDVMVRRYVSIYEEALACMR
jgi:glycosyltransferase involved in cell wall biosynthesis